MWLVQKKTTTINEQHQLNERQIKMGVKEETNTKSNAQKLLLSTDSSQYDYAIQLWPRGNISIIPGKEIKGEFDSLVIKGKQQQAVKLSEMLNVEQEQDSNIITGLLDSKRISLDQKQVEKKSSYQLKWVLLGFGLIIFIVLLLVWKKFF